jgi:hypothetical protein
MSGGKLHLRKILLWILLLLLVGCQGERAEEGSTTAQNTLVLTDKERLNPFSVWDGLAAKHDVDGAFMVDSPEEPDLFNLYLEGLSHPSPYVEWFASNKISTFSDHPDQQKAIDALQYLLNSPQDNVKSAAQFALQVLKHDFDDPAFIHSLDGKKVAFHLYQGARYNDGQLWIYNSEWNAVIPLSNRWLSIEQLEWSPDGKKLAIEYGGRIWGNVDLIDPDSGQSLLKKSVYDVLNDNKLYTVVERQRPDPYYRLIEWSPDSTKAMLSYSFTDDDEKVQQGMVIYDLNKSEYTTITPYPSGDNPYPDIHKPDGFKW